MMKVLVLGASGMLGSMIVDYLDSSSNYSISATVRSSNMYDMCKRSISTVDWVLFDAEKIIDNQNNFPYNSINFDKYDYVINCIGLTKHYINDDNPILIEKAIKINSLFPYYLGKLINNDRTKIIQIATDCVYSGDKGEYNEHDFHDPIDVYGKTKSLGEAKLDSFIHLRSSIIGLEFKSNDFLLEWVLKQKEHSRINGYTNHFWNGITTLHFAKICDGIISKEADIKSLQHILPQNKLSKFDIVNSIAKVFNKEIEIIPFETENKIDRTLNTINSDINKKLWKYAGYDKIPTIEEMIIELSNYPFRFKNKSINMGM